MTHAPPPGPPRARIPGPRRSPPPRRRVRGGRWRRRLWGTPALLVPAALIGYAAQKAASLPTLLLLGGSLVCAALALHAPNGQGRDRM
ncbi:hypothetical protein [Streptomyces sp. NPDC004629]|uniref:hypothetical protein n=1 Tax=Streptomyces sp. NPDC004629 TaxID=3364705 RepID=UPI0036AEB7DD